MWRCKQARTALLNYLTVKLLKTKLWNYEAAKLRLKLQGCDLFRVSFAIIKVKPSFVALSFSVRPGLTGIFLQCRVCSTIEIIWDRLCKSLFSAVNFNSRGV